MDRRNARLLVLALLLSGCTDVVAPKAALDRLGEGPVSLTLEPQHKDEDPSRAAEIIQVRIARDHPVFGGFQYDSTGTLNVYLTRDNPGARQAIMRSLRPMHDTIQLRFASRGAPIVFHAADYSFRDLRLWRDRAQYIFRIAGVQTLSIDVALSRVKIGVDPTNPNTMMAVEAEIDRLKVPREAVTYVEVREPVCPLSDCYGDPGLPDPGRRSLKGEWDVLVPGISVGRQAHYALGTLGFAVFYCDPANFYQCGSYFAITSHQTFNYARVDSDRFMQPEDAWGARAVLIERFDPKWHTLHFPINPWPDTAWSKTCNVGWVKCRRSDLALVALTGERGFSHGVIARPIRRSDWSGSHPDDLVVDMSQPYLRITAEGAAVRGQIVDRIGQNTGWRAGRVEETCVDVSVRTQGLDIVWRCQVGTTYHSQDGDSGSPVFWRTGDNTVTLLGIHHVRRHNLAFYSPLANIRNDLGLPNHDRNNFRVISGTHP